MTKVLPKSIASYDLLKTRAVIFMVIDHIGFFFYPENLWLRTWGRFSAPIWFFLIGYAETRHVQKSIWIGGIIIAVSRMVSGIYLFPLDVLFVLAGCRLIVDDVIARALKNYEAFIGMFLLLFFAAIPSMLFFEYGSIGLMLAMLGYVIRHKKEIHMRQSTIIAFAVMVGASYALSQILLMPPMSGRQMFTLIAGMEILTVILYRFRPTSYPRLTSAVGFFAPAIRFMGRYTLEIYVVHLLIFTAIAMALTPVLFPFLGFHWFPSGMLALFEPTGG